MRKDIGTIALSVLAVFTGELGCALRQATPIVAPAPTQAVTADDRLRIDDVLEIRVVGESEISGPYRIDTEGEVQVPYAGKLHVAGLRVGDVHHLLTDALKREYLRDPQVAVHVKEWNSRKVSVLGEVNKPGPVAFFSGMTIVDAIAAAGGFTKIAAPNSVQLRREADGHVDNRQCRVADIGLGKFPNIAVLPGDLIVVEERLF